MHLAANRAFRRRVGVADPMLYWRHGLEVRIDIVRVLDGQVLEVLERHDVIQNAAGRPSRAQRLHKECLVIVSDARWIERDVLAEHRRRWLRGIMKWRA